MGRNNCLKIILKVKSAEDSSEKRAESSADFVYRVVAVHPAVSDIVRAS